MRKLYALLVGVLLLLPATTASAAWPTSWRNAPGGGGSTHSGSISYRGKAWIPVTTSVAITNDSPWFTLLVAATICVDTDTGTLAAAGAFTMDVMRNVGTTDTATASIIVAQLSSATPCVFDAPPGRYYLEATASADTTGEVSIQASEQQEGN